MKTTRARIIVLGYLVRGPLGGLAWHHLQYAMGLSRLGHDVYFMEDSDDYPGCYDPDRNVTSIDPTYGLAFALESFKRAGLGDRWAYHDAHTGRWYGPCADRIVKLGSTTDLLLNVSGVNPLRPWLMAIPARAFIDTDPVFTQVRHLTDSHARSRALQHTAFFTFAENVGRPGCRTPADGLAWQATRQPVVLDAWPMLPGRPEGNFTTVMQWDSYESCEHDGVRYGMKSMSFGPFLDLPAAVGPIFELAVGSPTVPRAALQDHGWSVIDSRTPTRDPWIYQQYIQGSKAEFAVAKHGYVVSQSGWFSERTAGYLASGRPALVQQTGFSDWLTAPAGVIPFSTREEAINGVIEINRRYEHHCRAARAVVEEYFDARTVLQDLVERALTPVRHHVSPASVGQR